MREPWSEPRAFPDFLSGGWRDLPFEPFRDGVEISVIAEGAPTVALLRYAPGASVPRHQHPGLETVLVLEGSQRDERGVYRAGALVLNTVASEHDVRSDDGCVVLIQWAEPVQFVSAEERQS